MYYEKKPKLEISFVAQDVVNLKKYSNDIKILVNGSSIEQDKIVQLLKVKVLNVGNESLLENHYDRNFDWGVEIHNADVLSSPIAVDTNLKYSLDYLKPNFSGNKIIFKKILMEQGGYFGIDLFISKRKDDVIKIAPQGRIIGEESLWVTERKDEQLSTPIWALLISNGLLIIAVSIFIFVAVRKLRAQIFFNKSMLQNFHNTFNKKI